ncbi:MAG: hypothetical protein QXU18_00800 [Thermoplasmatales archaeon]
MKVVSTRSGLDEGVGVVIGALLLTVILFAALSAYVLYYVPSTAYSNETASLVSEENGFLSLSQKVNTPPYTGSILSASIPLGYDGVPPFSASTPGTLSYSNNTSVFQAYLNYTYTINLVNSTLTSILQPDQVAILPITITSSVKQPSSFDERLVIDSANYKGIEAGNLSNIFFTYTNGTVIPSWIENNNTNTSTSTTYWMKLNALAANSPVVVDMVFLPTTINIMNSQQTGEASQLSPVFGEYNDMGSVFGNGLEYQIYCFIPNYFQSNFNSQGYQSYLYQASMQSGTTITIPQFYTNSQFAATSGPFYTPSVGSSQAVNGKIESNVIMNFEEGYKNGLPYPNPPVSNPSGSWLIKMIGFAEVNVSSKISGGTDDGMSMGYSTDSSSSSVGGSWLNASDYYNLFNHYIAESYSTYSGSVSQPGTFSFNMNYFEDAGAAYTAVWSSSAIVYFHPIFPSGTVYPTANLGKVAIENLTSIPITITNNQQISEPSVYQQRLVIDNAPYQSREAANLQNIIFTYPNGTIIPSWLEVGNSNLSAESEYWLSLSGMSAKTSQVINMLILPQQLNMFNDYRTGESPQFSSGVYDDGSVVFPFYDSGNYVSQFSTVNAGTITVSTQNGPYGSPVSVISLSGSGTTTTSCESVAWIKSGLGGDLIMQSWINLNGNMNAMFAARGASDATTTNYILGDGWYGDQSSIAYESGSTNDLLAASGSRSNGWCFVTSELNGSSLSVVVSNDPRGAGGTILSEALTTSTTIAGSLSQFGGIATWAGSTSPAYFYLLRAITLPANGVMPAVSIGQKVSNATNNNVIVEHSNLHIYGTFNSIIGPTLHGTGLYLADGSVALSSGTSRLLGNILPINITQNSYGMNLSLSGVSIMGSNISTSVDGSSLVRLSNFNSTALSYYKGEGLSLLYHDSIPYSAQVGSINLTGLSYVITGILAPVFNYTLYSKFGTGESVLGNGQWYMGSGAILVKSSQNLLRITLSTPFALLNSISTTYAAYSLLDI